MLERFQILKHLALPHIAQSGRIGLISVASDPPIPKLESSQVCYVLVLRIAIHCYTQSIFDHICLYL